MAVAFGKPAERYVAALDVDLPIVACSAATAVHALAAAVDWRRAGRFFCVAPLVDDPRAVVAQRLAGRWMERHPNIDERYEAFDTLGDDRATECGMAGTLEELTAIPEAERRVLRDVAIMGDVLLVRSQREAERVGRVLQRRRPVVLAVPGTFAMPAVTARRGETVVVWAPNEPADALGVIAMALEYMRCPVVYVCRSGSLANVRGAFVDVAAGAMALSSAACVIDASIGEPASAIALAGLGLPLVTASTAGAAEFVAGVIEYDPWNWRTVFAAVSAARGAEAPRVRPLGGGQKTIGDALSYAQRALPVRGPVVSVVVLTYNRRELLPAALDSVAFQRYGDIELIVVNNGGADVADIVARYPGARLLTLPENILPNAAVEHGFAACSGKYFAVISDDDEYYPDHFARLVAALERSGDAVGHTNTVTRYLDQERGNRETVAYRVRGDRPSDRLQILVGGTMSFHSMLFRRDVRTTIGTLRVDLAPADLEFTVRAAQQYDFIHVDAVTCEWNCAIDGSSYTFRNNMYEGLKEIYDTYPSGPSTIVERRRAAELERFSTRRAGEVIWPPDALLPAKRD